MKRLFAMLRAPAPTWLECDGDDVVLVGGFTPLDNCVVVVAGLVVLAACILVVGGLS